mmetsp:Transcript_111147/g.314515  ORF Transcript_111147/g.314515 Transcript_111147/m.314515 type:complete len:233 (-) Transcript_111147:909-1607(-)
MSGGARFQKTRAPAGSSSERAAVGDEFAGQGEPRVGFPEAAPGIVAALPKGGPAQGCDHGPAAHDPPQGGHQPLPREQLPLVCLLQARELPDKVQALGYRAEGLRAAQVRAQQRAGPAYAPGTAHVQRVDDVRVAVADVVVKENLVAAGRPGRVEEEDLAGRGHHLLALPKQEVVAQGHCAPDRVHLSEVVVNFQLGAREYVNTRHSVVKTQTWQHLLVATLSRLVKGAHDE